MSYDVFISYAREDGEFTDQLYETCSRIFGLEVFRDVDRAHAGEFARHIVDALTEQPLPCLIVIASQSAVESPWVRREIDTFLDNAGREANPQVLPIQLTAGAAESLGLTQFQLIDLTESGERLDDELLVDRLWLALRGQAANESLQANRAKAEHWCAGIRPTGRPDFWGDAWRQYAAPLLDPASVASGALTAQGGSGKSVIAAHYVRALLDDGPKNIPVVVTEPQAIEPGEVGSTISRSLGVPSLRVLSVYTHQLAKRGYRTVFVVDGLDRIGRDPDLNREFLSALAYLASASTLVVTCRSEVWTEFAELSIDEIPVGLLDRVHVDRVLRQHSRFQPTTAPELLRVPFFLDAVLQAQDDMLAIGDNETDILASLWRRYTRPMQGPIPEQASPQQVLHRLALLQLRTMTYLVRRDQLEQDLHDAGYDERAALRELLSRGIVVQTTLGRRPVVRLRHDLLDCFGMVQVLLDETDDRRRAVYEGAAEDIGWALIAALVQFAQDRHSKPLIDEVFGALLEMLDKKRFGDAHMARAWAATYVLRSKLTILLPSVIACLDGRQVSSLTGPDQAAASSATTDPRVTRESASSLASAFGVIESWSAADPDRAIPMLAMNLTSGRWPHFRRRFVEALANYRRPDAVSVLETFAVDEIRKVAEGAGDADLGILSDLADAIRKLGADAAQPLLQSIIDVSRTITARSSIHPAERGARIAAARAERAATRAKEELGGRISGAALVGEEELLESLKPMEFAPGSQSPVYTDWRLVQWAASEAHRKSLVAGLSARLRDGLIEALDHDHTRVRTAVVRCLGSVDHHDAREAVLAELLEPALPAEVRRECLAALRAQLAMPTTPAQQAARRWVLQAALRRADQFTVADDLRDLLEDPLFNRGSLVHPTAFELTRTGGPDTVLKTVLVEREESDSFARQLVTAQDKRVVGVGLENKYRLRRLDTSKPKVVTAELMESTWREGAGFHQAMRRLAPIAPETVDDILTRSLTGSAPLPGLAAVHCVVTTVDSRVVLARRGARTPYAPNRWSITFEEQLVDKDLMADTDAFTAAARRGFNEEFGGDVTVVDTWFLGALMEMPIVNPSVVVALTTSETFAQLHARWEATGDPREIVELSSIELSAPIQLNSTDELHPTARPRLELLTAFPGPR